jgi:hypothetical protein
MKKQSLDVLVSKTSEYLNEKSIDSNNMEEIEKVIPKCRDCFYGNLFKNI